jgi:hypothetical protein
MKWKLNAYGNLLIERKGVFVKQKCINGHKPCGDHCPMFGEPNPTSALDVEICCGKKFKLYNFTDERNYKEESIRSEKLSKELTKLKTSLLEEVFDEVL